MGIQVVTGASIMCSFGAAPSVLSPIPKGPPVMAGGPPVCTIMDHVPIANIKPFGVCRSPANPMVAAAMAIPPPGVLKPMPCIPVTPAPWVPGSPTVLINNFPALNNSSKCMCTWGGVIQIVVPGQFTTMVA
ncbi:MAG: DUF4280 domain-containing protein [Polaromonas sp.]